MSTVISLIFGGLIVGFSPWTMGEAGFWSVTLPICFALLFVIELAKEL